MKRAAGYIRRSTDDKQADSIDIQREEITKYASAHDYQIVRWYVDDGISGHDVDRDDFVRMIEDAERSDAFQFVLVRHQSRFARFRPAKTIRYLDRLDDAGVKLVTTKQGAIDINDLAQFLLASIEAQTDHAFSKTLSELTIRGQAKQAAKGYSAGQAAPYGYDRMLVDEQGIHQKRIRPKEKVAKPDGWHTTFVLGDEDKVATVQWIYAEYANGKSPWTIAKNLNERAVPSPRGGKWNKGSIRSILQNRIYAGDFQWNKRREGKFHSLQNGKAVPRPTDESAPAKSGRRKHAVFLNDPDDWLIVEDAHEAIIDRAVWFDVQTRMSRMDEQKHPNRGVAATGKYRYALSGLVYCQCGAKMHGRIFRRQKNGKEFTQRKYVCSAYDSNGTCKFNWADAEYLHDKVVSVLCERLRDEETLDRLIAIINRTLAKPTKLEPQIRVLVRQVAELEGKIREGAERLLFCEKDLMEETSQVLRSLKSQKRAAEAELASLRSQATVLGKPTWTREQVVENLAELANKFESVEPEELHTMLKSTIDRVQLKFETVDGKKQRLSGGEILISNSTDSGMAGAGFEPTTSRL